MLYHRSLSGALLWFLIYSVAIEQQPPPAYYEQLSSAGSLLKQGKFPEAAGAYRAILERDPKSAEAQAGLIRSLLRADNFDEAEAAAANAVGSLPQSAVVQAALGDLDFRIGKFADAEAAYRTSLKLDPNCARGFLGMARMFEMSSMHKMGKVALAKAHQLDPGDREIYELWLTTLSYADQLQAEKKAAGDHPTDKEKRDIQFLSAVVEKKPWLLSQPIKPAEIKMEPYGRSQAPINKGGRRGATPISIGYGLQVKFNDRASAVLSLDTGAHQITLGRKLGESAGVVKIADTYIGGIGDQGPVESYLGWVDKIDIGGVEFRNCIVKVSSKDDIVGDAGLIGTDVFDNFLVTLDFENWKLLLSPLPANPEASVDDDEPQDRYIAPEMQSFTRIWRFGHRLLLPVLVSDKATGNFTLDTGADQNSMSLRLAQQITKVRHDGRYSIRGVSGKVNEVLSGDEAILQFAKIRVRSDDIPVHDFDNVSDGAGTEISGHIGIRTLVQMKLTIDYRDGLVNFEPYTRKAARE